MANRSDLAKQFMSLQADGKTDDAIAMLADDVVASNPMTGTQTGKPAVEAGIRSQPAGGGGMTITWGEPAVDGDVAHGRRAGSPFGPIKIILGFNASDQINKIDIGLALSLRGRGTTARSLGAPSVLRTPTATARRRRGSRARRGR